MKIIITILCASITLLLSGCISAKTSFDKVYTAECFVYTPKGLWRNSASDYAVQTTRQKISMWDNVNSKNIGPSDIIYVLFPHTLSKGTPADAPTLLLGVSGRELEKLKNISSLPADYFLVSDKESYTLEGECTLTGWHYRNPWLATLTIPADIITSPIQLIGLIIFLFCANSGHMHF
ncbi:MAG: hypothetical protein RIQ79_146 [Verrucomicrobiota bacterium]